MTNAININEILDSDNHVAFIEFLKSSSKTKNIKLLLPAFEEFIPKSAKKCMAVVEFIKNNNSTDLSFLLESYLVNTSAEHKTIKFYSQTDLSK